MTKKRATHTGHCQICDKVQKLPNGLLAKHGYSVEYSMFSGTCPGSEHLPLEKSCRLLIEYLPVFEKHVKDLEAYRDKVLQPSIEPKCFGYVFLKSNYHEKKDLYGWVEGDIVIKKFKTFDYFFFRFGSYQKELSNINGLTPLQLADEHNANYVFKTVNPQIIYAQKEVEKCKNKIVNWTEQPLTSI